MSVDEKIKKVLNEGTPRKEVIENITNMFYLTVDKEEKSLLRDIMEELEEYGYDEKTAREIGKDLINELLEGDRGIANVTPKILKQLFKKHG